MLRVGLTGGIACGKSHVLRQLAARGLRTLDLDAVSREVTARGSPGFAEIVGAFGASVVGSDGALDRGALGARVFADERTRARLNAIVHPRVRAAEGAWAAAFAGRQAEVLVTDGALLVEAGVQLRFDRLVVVHCDPTAQLARLRRRDGLDAQAALARVAAQMPLAEKRCFAHLELDTSGSLDETSCGADGLAEELIGIARERRSGPGAEVETLVGGLAQGPDEGPRGLSAAVLLAEAEAGELELERLAGRLRPPARRPWYRTAEEADPGPAPTYLSLAVAAWALRRGAPDAPFLAAAMGAVARLSHTDAEARADACLLALVAQEIAQAPGAVDVEAHARRVTPLAARFAGAPPSGRLGPVWSAVRRWPHDPLAAGETCARGGGEAILASALAGIGAAVGGSPRVAALRTALARVAASPR